MKKEELDYLYGKIEEGRIKMHEKEQEEEQEQDSQTTIPCLIATFFTGILFLLLCFAYYKIVLLFI